MNCLICLGELNKGGEGEYHPACLTGLFGRRKANPVLPFDKEEILRANRLEPVTKRMSISGVQMKLSVKLADGVLLPGAEKGEYILKPSPPEFRHAAENEHLSMLIGKFLGIETPRLGLVRFKDGEPAYLIRRFDRNGGKKLRKEDMCQIFGIPREAKYSKTYEEAGKKIREAVGGDVFPAYEFFRRVAFNFLIANGDYHLKNISLMYGGTSGESTTMFDRLSPNYDSLNTKLYMVENSELALEGGLLADGLTRDFEELGFHSQADFTELARRLGIGEKAALDFYARAERGGGKILSLVDASLLPADMKDDYKKIFLDQLKKLLTPSPFARR